MSGGNENNYCTICNGTENLKIIHKVYKKLGMSISYSDLLVKCFYIQFLDTHLGKDNMLCSKCIASIRFCVNFRKQVEMAHQRLYNIKPESIEFATNYISTTGTIELHDNTTNQVSMKDEPSSNIKEELESVDYSDNTDTFHVTHDYSDNNDIFHEESELESDSSSVKTDEIFRATGYKDSKRKPKQEEPLSIPKLEPTQTQCPLCEKQFPDNYLLNKHYKIHYPAYICHVCGMSFTAQLFYRKHLVSHSDAQYSCDMCDKKYKLERSLTLHKKQFHFNQHPHFCRRCKISFKYRLLQKKHMLSVHGIKCKMIKCPKCDQEFFTTTLMENHLNRKHLKYKEHQCTACYERFYNTRDLKAHYSVKHEGIKSHKCEFCDKTFSYSRGLRTHRKIHLNQRDHVCQLCGAAFVQQSSLKYHVKTHHSDVP